MEIEVFVFDHIGGWKLPPKATRSLVFGIGSEFLYVVRMAITRLDAKALFILAKGAAKSAINKTLHLKMEKKLMVFTPQELQRVYSMFFERNGGAAGRIQIRLPKQNLRLESDLSSPEEWLPLLNVSNVFFGNQYGAEEKNIKDRVVADAGANAGTFTFYAASLGARKVYAFEPVYATYLQLKANVILNGLQKRVIVVNKALGDRNCKTQIVINHENTGNSTISDSKSQFMPKDKSDVQEVEMVRLDDFLEGEELGFMKMDVEGYEEEVIRGASRIISRDKPILSLSAYHKPTDKEVLPKLIRSIRSDYEIKLEDKGEPDFFCH